MMTDHDFDHGFNDFTEEPCLGMDEPHACDRCGTIHDEARGDGYCGLCPSCADATEPKGDDDE